MSYKKVPRIACNGKKPPKYIFHDPLSIVDPRAWRELTKAIKAQMK